MALSHIENTDQYFHNNCLNTVKKSRFDGMRVDMEATTCVQFLIKQTNIFYFNLKSDLKNKNSLKHVSDASKRFNMQAYI